MKTVVAGAESNHRHEAGWASDAGVPLTEALRTIRARMQALFGDAPLALVDATVTLTYMECSNNARGLNGSLP